MRTIRCGLMILVVGAWSLHAGAQDESENGTEGCGAGSCGEGCGACVTELPSSGPIPALTKKDRQGILFMHEEEKLARDVYRHLGRKWNLRPFQNIQRSEQTHIDAMAGLIERYGLTARSASEDEGVYGNTSLRKLYTRLIADGEASEIAALRVGAYVEEVDIEDLDNLIASTGNPELKQVAESLRMASGNHLRAFVRNLSRRGVEHVPTVLTPEVYDAIAGEDRTRMGGG